HASKEQSSSRSLSGRSVASLSLVPAALPGDAVLGRLRLHSLSYGKARRIHVKPMACEFGICGRAEIAVRLRAEPEDEFQPELQFQLSAIFWGEGSPNEPILNWPY